MVLLILGSTNIYKNRDNKVKDKGFNPEFTSINKNAITIKNKEYKYFFLRHTKNAIKSKPLSIINKKYTEEIAFNITANTSNVNKKTGLSKLLRVIVKIVLCI